jgi:small-conductance mechanosensitive channel
MNLDTIDTFVSSQTGAAGSFIDKMIPALSGVFVSAFIAIGLWVLYRLATKALKKYVIAKAFRKSNGKSFLLLWRYVWLFVGSIIVIFSLSGSLTALGLSAAFLGMILGWSLQAPVTGIAAWLMVVLKRPFKIGDRIIVDGIIGDVTDISLTHISLNQVGGTVSGEDPSGRGVLIPNGTLFSTKIFNYAFESSYILDEVAITVTYSSNLHKAEELIRIAAVQETGDIIARSKQEPYTRVMFVDSGIRISLRYQTRATNRSEVSSAISRRIFDVFKLDKSVQFAYPHMQVIYNSEQKSA